MKLLEETITWLKGRRRRQWRGLKWKTFLAKWKKHLEFYRILRGLNSLPLFFQVGKFWRNLQSLPFSPSSSSYNHKFKFVWSWKIKDKRWGSWWLILSFSPLSFSLFLKPKIKFESSTCFFFHLLTLCLSLSLSSYFLFFLTLVRLSWNN